MSFTGKFSHFRRPVLSFILCRQHTKSNHYRRYSNALQGKTVRIGCGSGFWGDTSVAAPQLIYGDKLDYVVYDYLSEITMSLLVATKRKFPDMGYAPDFLQVCIAPYIKDIKKKGLKVISNAGGINPLACGAAIQKACQASGVDLNVAVVTGDDLMEDMPNIAKRGITDMDSSKEFPKTINSMTAYLGAGPIARALDRGADIVVTGRCVDSALVLGPLIHSFQWKMNNFDNLAAGSLAGHLIECGAQATGGIFTDWHKVDNWDNIGFPVVECASNGEFVVTKPPKTGGLVSNGTVREQLVYEIGDPAHYFLPDVVCDFTSVQTEELPTANVVKVTGAKGNPPSGEYKICATYADGYRSTAVSSIGGPRAKEKAEKVSTAIIKRCRRIFKQLNMQDFTDVNIEVLGTESIYGPHARNPNATREGVTLMAAHHSDKKALEIFGREVAPAGTGMAPGLMGLFGGRPKVSPTLVERASTNVLKLLERVHFDSPACHWTPVFKLFSFLYPKSNLKIDIHMNGEHAETYEQPPVPTEDYVQSSNKDDPMNDLPKGECSYRVEELAFTRSGDKGNNGNIGVIARHPDIYPYLKNMITEEVVENYFSHLWKDRTGDLSTRIKRYELPGIHALNFVLFNSLGGGGIASLRSDPQGKAFGQMLLDLELDNIPDFHSKLQDSQ